MVDAACKKISELIPTTFIFRLYEKSIQACLDDLDVTENLIEGSEQRNQWAKGWMAPMTYLKLLPHKAAYAEFVNKQEAQRKTKRE
jgi:hypothetical protein